VLLVAFEVMKREMSKQRDMAVNFMWLCSIYKVFILCLLQICYYFIMACVCFYNKVNSWLFVSCCSFAVGQKLVIKGSDTLGAKMVPQLSEVYKTTKSNSLQFEIVAEGSSTCFKALLADSADIGMSSRSVKESEIVEFKKKGLKLNQYVVGIDMIAVVVNKENPIKNLTQKQLEEIFTGETTSWKKLGWKGDIRVITRNTSSGTYKTFQKLAMNKKNYGKNTQKMAGNYIIPQVVVKDEKGISYVGLAYTKKEGVKPIAIDGVSPEAKNAQKYPLSRNLYFYTAGEESPMVKDFIKWVRESKEASKVIHNVGFVSVSSTKN